MTTDPFIEAHNRPGEVLLLPVRRGIWWLVLLCCALFVAIGVGMIHSEEKLGGWLAVGFFGFGALVAVIVLFMAGRWYLFLSSEGLTQKMSFRTWSLRWSEVSEFQPVYMGVGMVAFDLIGDAQRPSALRKFNRETFGFEAAIACEYGLKAKELAELLNEWRERHLKEAGEGGA